MATPSRTPVTTLRLAGGRGETVEGALALGPAYATPKAVLASLKARRGARRVMRKIIDGQWRKAILDGDLEAQHRYREVTATAPTTTGEDRTVTRTRVTQLIDCVNLIGLAARTFADICYGNPVTITVEGDDGRQALALDTLHETALLDATHHEAAVKVNEENEAYLRVTTNADGQVTIVVDDNEETFPVGPRGESGQPTVYERRWIIEEQETRTASSRKRRTWLRVERHRVVNGGGLIEQEAYETNSSDVLADLAELPRVRLEVALTRCGIDPAGVPERVETGAPYPMVVQLVNMRRDGAPRGRLDKGDLSLVETLISAFSRIDRGMEIHGLPRFRVPESAIGPDGKVKMSTDAVYDPEKLWEAMVVDLGFDAMEAWLRIVMQLTLMRLEVSPALLGWKPTSGAAPDTVEKLSLESTQTIAAAKRTRPYHGSALSRLYTVASWAMTMRPNEGWPVQRVKVAVHPELPKSEMEKAKELDMKLKAGLIDELTALEELHGPDRAAVVHERMKEDRARDAENQMRSLGAEMPPVFSGGAA